MRVTKSGKGLIVWVDDEAYTCYIGSVHDLLEGKRKQVQLKAAGSFSAPSFDAKPEGLVRTVEEGGYIYYNKLEGVYEIRLEDETLLVCERGLDGLTAGEIGRVKIWRAKP